jgi:hypothetical protein
MWLKPGAGLLVGVPNLASLQARIGGQYWYHLDVPRHRTPRRWARETWRSRCSRYRSLP